MATSIKGNSESRCDVHFEHHVEGYSQLSAMQQCVIQAVIPHITQVVVDVVNSKEADSSLVVVDYGAADGLNSIPIIAACNEAIADKIHRIIWIFNDACTPNTDCTSFIQEEVSKCHHVNSSQRFTFQYKTGNFYDKVMTEATVDLGISLNALHWLSRRPVTSPNTRALSTDPVTRSIAATDWLNFLNARATELKPGGRMVLHVTIEDQAEDRKPDSVCTTGVVGEAISDLYLDGIITKEEQNYTSVIPACYRPCADLIAPFNNKKSGLDKSIKLLSFKTHFIEDPFYQEWLESGGLTDKDKAVTEAYIIAQVNFVKSFANTQWSFTKETRTEEEYHFILDRFYKAVELRIRNKPGAYNCAETFAIIDIVKLIPE